MVQVSSYDTPSRVISRRKRAASRDRVGSHPGVPGLCSGRGGSPSDEFLESAVEVVLPVAEELLVAAVVASWKAP